MTYAQFNLCSVKLLKSQLDRHSDSRLSL